MVVVLRWVVQETLCTTMLQASLNASYSVVPTTSRGT